MRSAERPGEAVATATARSTGRAPAAPRLVRPRTVVATSTGAATPTRPPAANRPAGAGGGGRAVSRRSTHIPGFDGLRGIALLGVLCFHQAFGWARGGFLGVSTFFTLSGFLIGRVTFLELLREHRLGYGRFWVRRVRRLVPAAVVTILATAAVCRVVDLGPPERIRGDLLAALGWVANWRLLAEGSGYQASFAAPSPVQHFWSLAIEEQFYLVFPLLAAGVVAAVRERFAAVAGAFAALAALGFATAAAVARHRPGDAYYASHTRAAELLVGVAFAAWSMTPAFARIVRRRPQVVAGAGVVGLAGLLALYATQTASAPSLFRGATALNALATVAVLAACVVPGPVAKGLGVGALRQVGRFSYGAYLYHWMVFLVVAPPRVHLDPWPLFGVRVAITAGLAVLSGLLLEEPIRFGRRIAPLRVAGLTAACLGVTAALLVAIPVSRPPSRPTDRIALPSEPVLHQARIVAPVRARQFADAPLHVLYAGDSEAYTSIAGFTTWNQRHPERPVVLDAWINFGCPVHGTSPIRLMKQVLPLTPECQDMPSGLAREVAQTHPDVVVFLMGFADLAETEIDGTWRHVGEPAVDERIRERYRQVVDAVGGTRLVLLVPPAVDPRDQPPTIPRPPYREARPERAARLQELVREVAAAEPDRVELLDLGAWCEARADRCLSPEFRPDGVHFSRAGADAVADLVVTRLKSRT